LSLPRLPAAPPPAAAAVPAALLLLLRTGWRGGRAEGGRPARVCCLLGARAAGTGCSLSDSSCCCVRCCRWLRVLACCLLLPAPASPLAGGL
jgi:hypothetical protein